MVVRLFVMVVASLQNCFVSTFEKYHEWCWSCGSGERGVVVSGFWSKHMRDALRSCIYVVFPLVVVFACVV